MALPPYSIPKLAQEYDHVCNFEQLCKKCEVNPVNHGEFEEAAEELITVAQHNDEDAAYNRDRCVAFVIQRCRRGGKTFMLNAVASRLCEKQSKTPENERCHVILISLNTKTPYDDNEDPYTAILSRIAYGWHRILGEDLYFHEFRQQYSNYDAVRDWLHKNKVILLIDELNKISPSKPRYALMNEMLDKLVGRKGGALMYSTHLRGYASLLRGRNRNVSFQVSTRTHQFMRIPRVRNIDCLIGLQSDATNYPSLWSAVLRARIPSLILLGIRQIEDYAQLSFEREAALRMDQNRYDPTGEDLEEHTLSRRIAGLSSALTGDVGQLDGDYRDEFKAYSYMSRRKEKKRYLYAWPPFLLADEEVLGKKYPMLHETLCCPQIDEAKAFEALTQLAILLRLLTSQSHDLVPVYTEKLLPAAAFKATDMYHVGEEAKDLDSLTRKVAEMYALRPGVMQAVVVPLYASFPVYDFFLFHRDGEKWAPAAGYQCKLGQETPDENHKAWEDVGLSVWIGGSCRRYRVEDGVRVASKEKYGWVLMVADMQYDMLGVSISEALPENVTSLNNPLCTMCDAEIALKDRREALSEGSKRQKTT